MLLLHWIERLSKLRSSNKLMLVLDLVKHLFTAVSWEAVMPQIGVRIVGSAMTFSFHLPGGRASEPAHLKLRPERGTFETAINVRLTFQRDDFVFVPYFLLLSQILTNTLHSHKS